MDHDEIEKIVVTGNGDLLRDIPLADFGGWLAAKMQRMLLLEKRLIELEARLSAASGGQA